jgi:hypothetical protein
MWTRFSLVTGMTVQKLLLSLFLACVATTAAAVDEVIFNPKVFVDTKDVVHVQGTLTGDGIGNKNNRSALTCYQKEEQCLATHIDSQGMQVFSLRPPVAFTIRLWAADRITADFAAPCGKPPMQRDQKEWQVSESITWLIDRTRKTAEVIEHHCSESRTYHWTIEDPSYWRDAKERVAPK